MGKEEGSSTSVLTTDTEQGHISVHNVLVLQPWELKFDIQNPYLKEKESQRTKTETTTTTKANKQTKNKKTTKRKWDEAVYAYSPSAGEAETEDSSKYSLLGENSVWAWKTKVSGACRMTSIVVFCPLHPHSFTFMIIDIGTFCSTI